MSRKSILFRLDPLLLIIPLGLLIYSGTFQVPFIFDGPIMIAGNDAVTGPFDVAKLWHFHPGRFLTFLSFAFNHAVSGLEVWSYHLVNLTIHLGTALALGWLIRLLFSAEAGAPADLQQHKGATSLLAAILFVAHPVQTQAVTYIWQRATCLAALCYLLSLALFVKARTAGRIGEQRTSTLFWLASLACGLLAMFAKEIGFTLPLAVAAVEWFLLRARPRAPWWTYLPYVLLLAVVPLCFLANLDIYRERVAENGMATLAPATYLLTQVGVTLTYLRLFLFPIGQNLDYDYPQTITPTPVFFGELALLLVLLGLAFWLARKNRWLAAGPLFFFLALAVEGLAFTLPDVIFEHRLYLPMAGLSLFAAMLLIRLAAGRASRMYAIMLAAALLCGWLTWQRNQLWRSADALWSDTIAKSARKARPWACRGQVRYEARRWQEALADFDKALALDRDFLPALSLRATLNQRLGHRAAALTDFDRFLEHVVDLPSAYNNRGSLLLSMDLLDRAQADFDRALELAPDYALALTNRGQLAYRRQKFEAAEADLRRAAALAPQAAEPWFYLARCLEKRGDTDAALAAYGNCLQRDPDRVHAHLNQGLLLYRARHDLEGAMAAIGRALALDPDFAEAYHNRGALHYNERQYEAALVDFDRLVSLSGSGEAYYRRGLSLLELRRWEAAAADIGKAADLGVPIPEQVTMLLKTRPR